MWCLTKENLIIWTLIIQDCSFLHVWGSYSATIKFKPTLRSNWWFYYSKSPFHRQTDPVQQWRLFTFTQNTLSGVTQAARSAGSRVGLVEIALNVCWIYNNIYIYEYRLCCVWQSCSLQALLTLLPSSLTHVYTGLHVVLLVIDINAFFCGNTLQ